MNEYLWEFAQKIPSDNQFQVVLKSALLQTASAGADVGKTNDKWMCRKCKTLWMHGYFHVDEIKSTNRYDKLLEKYRNKAVRTKKQQSHFDYLMSRKRVTAKYTCKLCSYKTRITTANKNPTISESKKEEAVPSAVNSKKKKRNRDVNAGLNIPFAKSSPQIAAKKSSKASFNSKEPNHLNALAIMLKKSSEGMSSAGSLKPQDRLKLFLQ
ncbi:uncharacterized protein LOC135707258 [Ochlerotatus camptorhynchus]|uniref:uncharacterized protein LOC135707258 n=1 Tax=Ochlerotatus camptorhynchus TaxID=644619 RepID=UPI0031D8931C